MVTYEDKPLGNAATLEQVNLTYTAAANGIGTFSVQAGSADHRFSSAQVSGQHFLDTKVTQLTIQARDLDLVYAQKWIPPFRSPRVIAGRGELEGGLTLTPNAAGSPHVRSQSPSAAAPDDDHLPLAAPAHHRRAEARCTWWAGGSPAAGSPARC